MWRPGRSCTWLCPSKEAAPSFTLSESLTAAEPRGKQRNVLIRQRPITDRLGIPNYTLNAELRPSDCRVECLVSRLDRLCVPGGSALGSDAISVSLSDPASKADTARCQQNPGSDDTGSNRPHRYILPERHKIRRTQGEG